jgi:hypothetical protein
MLHDFKNPPPEHIKGHLALQRGFRNKLRQENELILKQIKEIENSFDNNVHYLIEA